MKYKGRAYWSLLIFWVLRDVSFRKYLRGKSEKKKIEGDDSELWEKNILLLMVFWELLVGRLLLFFWTVLRSFGSLRKRE